VSRTWLDGARTHPGFLEDQAAVTAGLLALHQATGDIAPLVTARVLATAMVRDFHDHGAQGFYDTARDHGALITRPRELTDNATPSGSAMACDVLLQLDALDGVPAYREIVAHLVSAVAAPMTEHPLGFGHWLGLADRLIFGAVQVALVGDAMPAMTDVLRGMYVPTLVLAQGTAGAGAPALLDGRTAIGGAPTAYVCRDASCELPTSDPQELARQLRHAVRRTR
jgi:uncharacterized protein YyaL (SSP411 family)